MRDVWYSDRRDLVKWASVAATARSARIKEVIWVALLPQNREASGQQVALKRRFGVRGEVVWRYFRDMHDIVSLGHELGIKITLADDDLASLTRDKYVLALADQLKRRRTRCVVFVDPDTGIAPDKRASLAHISTKHLAQVWDALKPEDWIVVYQHGDRTKDWLTRRMALFSKVTGVRGRTDRLPEVAKDAAIYSAKRERSPQP
jgi:hypothetical protein